MFAERDIDVIKCESRRSYEIKVLRKGDDDVNGDGFNLMSITIEYSPFCNSSGPQALYTLRLIRIMLDITSSEC